MEYPKWLSTHGIIVQNVEEERAVIEGTAVIEDVHSAQGVTRRIKSMPAPKPEDEPSTRAGRARERG